MRGKEFPQKKVLSLVLCVAVMLSVMVMGAGAAFSDQDKIENTEAVNMCTALNIIGGYPDGSYKPEGNIKRSEITKMICVALNGGKEPNVSTNTTPTFSDVRGTNAAWAEGYIESCVAQGIISGVGGGRFSPNGNVTGSQLAKMLLVSLGYNANTEGFVGNAWATNVNVIASQKGLYEGLESMDTSAALTRDNAAQMVWNAMNAYEVEYKTTIITDENGKLETIVTVQDKVVGTTSDKITLLEDKYEAKTFTGTFNGNADVCNLNDGEIQVYGSVNDSEKVTANFKYDFDLKYIGEEVNVLFKDGTGGTKNKPDNKDTIYGVVVTGATTVYNITKNDLQTQKEAGTVRFGDKNYDVAAAAKDYEYLNVNYGAKSTVGATSGTSADDVATAFSNLKAVSADTIKFVCNENGDITRAYVVESKLARVTAVNNEKVSLNNGVGSIKIEDNDIYKDVAKDDIVLVTTLYNTSATASDAYTTVTKAETVEGKLTGYNGVKQITVDGTTYDAYLDNIAQNKSVDSDFLQSAPANQIGETVKLYLVNGIAYAAEMVTETTQYAVVEDADGAIGDTFDPLKVKMMKADGTEATVEIHKDSKDTAKLKTGAIIKYSDVSDGKIKVTSVVEAQQAETAKPDLYDKDTKSFDKKVVASDGVLFVNKTTIPGDDEPAAVGDFYAYNIRNLNDIDLAQYGYYSYMMDSDGSKVVAAYVTLANKPSGASSDTVYGIVSSENGTVKVNDDTYTSYTVDVDESTQKTVLIEGDNDSTLKEGDLVSFDVASDDIYATSDITVYYPESNHTATNNAAAVFVKEYDEAGQILSYYTGAGSVSDGVYPGTGLTTKAVDEDVQIVYVDAEDNTAGSEIGVNAFDGVTGKANVVVVFEDNNISKPIVAIYVDVNSDIAQ